MVQPQVDWKAGGAVWAQLFATAEVRYAIPQDLLMRIAYQECSWRPEVINCTVVSPAGARGMMQLMPQYFPDAGKSIVNDINIAGQLLANLYRRFSDWQLAVAAYNWGQGNVHHAIVTEGEPTLADLPPETVKYVTQVFGDVPIEGALV